jgi:predicted amino acid-binding ACT domain protein
MEKNKPVLKNAALVWVVIQSIQLLNADQTIDKRKGTVLYLTHPEANQPAFKRLVDSFKADARKLGVNVEMTDNQDL